MSVVEDGRVGQRGHTQTAVREAHGLLEEAVELAHLGHRGLAPAVLRNDGLDLLAQGLEVLRIRGEVVQCVCERLRRASAGA